MQVRVSLSALGVECIRCVFGYADSNSDKCIYSFFLNGRENKHLYIIEEWINGAFDIEFIHGGAPAYDGARQMGRKYLSPTELTDAMNFYDDQFAKLVIQRQILDRENDITDVAPDRYSAFESYYNETGLDGRFSNG